MEPWYVVASKSEGERDVGNVPDKALERAYPSLLRWRTGSGGTGRDLGIGRRFGGGGRWPYVAENEGRLRMDQRTRMLVLVLLLVRIALWKLVGKEVKFMR